jgi:methylmalonyl-CoA/ethylmalonyl-CoA epimerase
MRYLGKPTGCIFSLALAYWGDMQIELIRPENTEPGIYRGDYGVDGHILHHTCILTDNMGKARKIAEAAGAKVLVEGKVGDDGAVIYVDSGAGAGSIVEILQPASGSESLFAMIKAASVGWDGSNPVRKLG